MMRWLLAGALLIFFNACSSGQARFKAMSPVIQRGEFGTLIDEIKKGRKDLYKDHDSFLYFFDLGVAFHYNLQPDSSIHYLNQAWNVWDDLFARSVTNEALAVMTNDNLRPYRPKNYEMVALHFFQMVNFAMQGNINGALVEGRRASPYLREQDRSGSKAYLEMGALFHFVNGILYESAGESDNAAISLFQSMRYYKNANVAAPEWVSKWALYLFSKTGRSQDIQAFAELNNRVGLAQDTTWCALEYNGRMSSLDEVRFRGTYIRDGLLVVYYRNPRTGTEEMIALPAPGLPMHELEKAEKGAKTSSGTTFQVSFTMPMVMYNQTGSPVPHPEALAVTSRSLEQFMEENQTSILTRTVIRVVLRTIAAQRAKALMQSDNPLLNLLSNLTTDVLSDQLEKADVRSAFILPAQFLMQCAATPTPAGVGRSPYFPDRGHFYMQIYPVLR
jgi:uncharacterized protein